MILPALLNVESPPANANSANSVPSVLLMIAAAAAPVMTARSAERVTLAVVVGM